MPALWHASSAAGVRYDMFVVSLYYHYYPICGTVVIDAKAFELHSGITGNKYTPHLSILNKYIMTRIISFSFVSVWHCPVNHEYVLLVLPSTLIFDSFLIFHQVTKTYSLTISYEQNRPQALPITVPACKLNQKVSASSIPYECFYKLT